jgi:hypothetical protein
MTTEQRQEQVAAEAMGLNGSMTLREWYRTPTKHNHWFVFARGRMQEVDYIDGYDVHCPKDNGGWGCTYALHADRVIWYR